MKKIEYILIIFVFLDISCAQKQDSIEPKIEIYLPKERIISNFGDILTDEWILSEFFENDTTLFQKRYIDDCSFFLHSPDYQIFTKVDSKTNNLIYAGPFTASEKDLKEEPFITDDEIVGFDFDESKIRITSDGISKIMKLTPNVTHSRQFIITADKKPILTGYFFSILSSYYVSHFYIEYSYQQENSGNVKPKTKDYEIFYNPKSKYEWETLRYNFKNNTEFYRAFKDANKLIE